MTAPTAPILVVEDDPDARDSLKFLLELDGHDVLTAAGADEALLLADSRRPAWAVVDLGLPDRSSGLRLARELRSRPEGSSLVIIVLTGWARHEDVEAAEAAGADHVMHKPIDPARLSALLRPAQCAG
jgi:DNA-binding response OmpR family regulator